MLSLNVVLSNFFIYSIFYLPTLLAFRLPPLIMILKIDFYLYRKIIKTIIYNLLVNNTLCEDIFYNYKIYFLYYKIVVFILQNGNII